MNLFNFDASNEYLLIPMKLTLSFFVTYSSFECNTLSGLFFDFSANSNSSNKIIDIGKFSLLISFALNFSSKELYLIILLYLQDYLILYLENKFELFVDFF